MMWFLFFIFVFMISAFVIRIFLKICREIVGQNLIFKSTLTKIGTLVFCIQMTLQMLVPLETYQRIFLLFVSAVLILGICAFLYQLRKRKLFDEVDMFLRRAQMFMQSGSSFRSSLVLSAQHSSAFFASRCLYLLENVVFSQQENDKILSTPNFLPMEQLISIDRSPQFQLQRLQALVSEHKKISDFRRRSGQQKSQIQIQAIIITIIYLALSAFVFANYGFNTHSKLWFVCTLWLIIGQIFLIRLGRHIKWTV